jgi:xanthine dehydrogenase accessory factor
LRLVVIGRGPEYEALCAHARFFGCEVHERPANGTTGGVSLGRAPRGVDVDPWTAIVLLFHDHEWEDALLDWALTTQAFYIGAQGGAAARDERVAALRARGHGAAALKRVRSPVGLIPHTREAEILALSILADLVAGHGELHPHR